MKLKRILSTILVFSFAAANLSTAYSAETCSKNLKTTKPETTLSNSALDVTSAQLLDLEASEVYNDTHIEKVDGIEGGGLSFIFETGEITDVDEGVTIANIPSEIDGVAVTSIGTLAFYHCPNLTSVSVPSSVENIGDDAFSELTALKTVTLSEGIKTIGYGAFSECSALESINLPNSLESIGAYCFSGCTYLTEISIPAINTVEECTFYDCTSLKKVNISNGVVSLGESAFGYCSSLESITIPSSVTNLGDQLFNSCSSLSEITIYAKEFIAGSLMFFFCDSLKTVYCYKGSTADKAELYDTYSDESHSVTIQYISGIIDSSTTTTTADPDTETTTKKSSSGGGGGSHYVSSDKTAESATTTEADNADTDTEKTSETQTKNKDIRVSIDSNIVFIGSDKYEMDAAPYIQTESNSTLVPLRFVALAILGGDVGDADTSDIISWDSVSKTASITVGSDLISFAADSNNVVINGQSIAMANGVKAEITDGRLYIPFRALGEALGVDVDWEADTKTAIYIVE